ncbi:DUF4349 domain-containing protein [Ralstonia pickettii]|nr:DUF4349 domain-containing protein [Ralstonia pickettii]
MKKVMPFLLMLFFILGACSNEKAEDTAEQNIEQALTVEESSEMDFTESAEDRADSGSASNDEAEAANEPAEDLNQGDANRKVIYTANIDVETESYSELSDYIQSETARLDGYVVEANMYRDIDNNHIGGEIIVRIPQKNFDTFIELVETGSGKVLNHYVSGQDVTEEFIDLESRLKSKKAVEERLLEFMANAEKTEDLLAISDNLANVQEEIETITGRMNYLQDKTDLATVTISIRERNVTLSGMNDDELNTWEETKKQFMRSINFIITAISALVVFIGGNAPVLVLLGIIGFIILLILKRKRKNKKIPEQEQTDEKL